MTTKVGMPKMLGGESKPLIIGKGGAQNAITHYYPFSLLPGGRTPARDWGPILQRSANLRQERHLAAPNTGYQRGGRVRYFANWMFTYKTSHQPLISELLDGLHKIGFRTHFGPDNCGFLNMAMTRGGGYYLGTTPFESKNKIRYPLG